MKAIAKLCCAFALLVAMPTIVMAQGISTAELHVTVKDVKAAVVQNASVTVRDVARGIERTTKTNVDGSYHFAALPPGRYNVTVEAPGFAKAVAKDLTLTIGEVAELPLTLQVAAAAETVNVNAETEIVETQRTTQTSTIQQDRIDNLPINGRNYINFTLTNSQIARDTAPSIGAAPTSGLNISGQRARSNTVNVDGVDAEDNSVNGIRSTVSQEAVQEFQILTAGYAPEYGRASGGVVNILTKGGTNDLHGNLFGYLRSRRFQAENPFTTTPDPAYTRTQAGATLGGPIKKDKTFFFFSYETTRRHETGFSTVGADKFGLQPFDATPFYNALGFPAPPGTFNIQATPDQVAYLTSGLQALANPAIPLPVKGQIAGAMAADSYMYGGSSGVAVNGLIPAAGAYQLLGFLPALSGTQFPTSCFAFTPTQNNVLCNGLPASFAPLAGQMGNYPVSEGTSIIALRLDHKINNNHNLFARVNVSPSTVTGLQVNAQNQNFGQNAFSRTSIQSYRDLAGAVQETATIGNNKVNEFRFQYARRGLLYNFNSNSPDGSNIGANIEGFAFIGREPFAPLNRTEEREQFSDSFSWSRGTHEMKFGADINRIPVSAAFQVNFGGVYDFGGLAASDLGLPDLTAAGFPATPGLSAVQAYGAGIPGVMVQGLGNPKDSFTNVPLGFYAQDSWRIKPNLTLNYGLRYDVELAPSFKTANPLTAASYAALGIQKGYQTDTNNFAPRIGIAWDPFKDGKTVIRASYGLFYDHPLLGLLFLGDATDGAGTPQVELLGGAPCGTSGGQSPLNLNATNVFQGTLTTANCVAAGSLGYLPNQQKFDPFFPNSTFINQNYLNPATFQPLTVQPFGFLTGKGFVYAYSDQVNFSVEHDLGHGFDLNVAYNYNGGHHLNRPINANTPRGDLLVANWQRGVLAGDFAPTTSPLFVTTCDPAHNVYPAALVSFFRPSGINPSLAPLFGPCTAAAQAFISSIPGFLAPIAPQLAGQIPFSDMVSNFSNGSSVYHGLTFNLKKRFSNHYEFLASYTWSHAIDDSTDLQSLLAPQDSYNPAAERANSTFDQRHRFVFSGVYQSGHVFGSGAVSKLLSNWTVAPLIEFSSGRPYALLSGIMTNFQFSPSTGRPNVYPASAPPGPGSCGFPVFTSPAIHNFVFQEPCFLDGSLNGDLGRNPFTKPMTIFNDIRIARRLNLTERFKLDAILDMFNIVNRFNVADVNPLFNAAAPVGACGTLAANTQCSGVGLPSSAFDPRQLQVALKLSW